MAQVKENSSNVFSTGGGGNVFEVSVQTAFVISAMLNGRIPSLPNGRIQTIRFQAKSATDDIALSIASTDGRVVRLLAQVKHKLTFTENNETFIEVVQGLWEDYNNEDSFDTTIDKLLIVLGDSNSKLRNHVIPVLDWAKAKQSWSEYDQELATSAQKQAVFDTFKEVLNTINEDREIGDESVWQFLRCVNVVDYDFSSDTSTHLAYFKTMIGLVKRNSVSATADEIWGSIYTYVANKNSKGATLTPQQLHEEFDYFTVGSNITESQSLQKLRNESQVLFDRLENTIGTVHINRKQVYEAIKPKFNNCQIIILSGDAGVGKSAFAKDLLLELDDTHVVAFAADQFQRSRFGITLSEMGVSEDITEIFSRLALLKHQVIYVDSMEKLAEGSADAFKELISLLKKNRQIKLVATCRDYALQPLVFEYLADFQNSAQIRIPNFSEDELQQVAELCPELKPVMANSKLSKLLNRPKYLAFAQKLVNSNVSNLQQIDQVAFLNELWNKIIKGEAVTKDNIHQKRAQVFVEVAVRRARKMTLYTEVSDLENDALYALERDGILHKHDTLYSPAHDILEDWALIRHISKIHQQCEDSNGFFDSMGTTPALRRGFRLWLEDEILRDEQRAYSFIQETLFNDQIAGHWKDEIIIALLNSSFIDKFLTDNQDGLLRNDAVLLSKFLHLLRVACKDLNQKPNGGGWDASVRFIYMNLDDLTIHHSLILGVLLDWERKMGSALMPIPVESEKVAQTLLVILQQLKATYDDYGNRGQQKDQIESSIKLIFRLAEVVQEEVKQLLVEAHTAVKNRKDGDWKTIKFYEKLLEYCLSGLYGGSTSKFFPKLIMEIAKEQWLEQEVEEENDTDPFRRSYRSPIGTDQYFGIKEYGISKYMPPSASQTFVSRLLLFHPVKALNFIVDILNYTTEKYAESSFAENHECKKLEIKVGGELVTEQWGGYVLWLMYRGKGVATPYLLQSILKALEHYLYQLGSIGTDWAIKNLQDYVDFLMKHSKSVATTSVLASNLMAYPKAYGEKLLYFVSNLEFLDWDSSRWMEDQTNGLYFQPSTVEELIFNKENQEADKWPHRKKYYRGLHQFIVEYQFNIKELNDEIFSEFDLLKDQSEGKEISWRKTLSEIDARNWKPGEYDEKHGGFVVQPDYDNDVQEMVDSFSVEQEENNKAAGFSSWIKSVNEGKEDEPAFAKWEECYTYYKEKDIKSGDFMTRMFDAPGTLASIGLQQFRAELSSEHLTWCSETILAIASNVLANQGVYDRPDLSVNIFDKEPVLAILVQVVGDSEIDQGIINDIKVIIFMLLLKMDAKHEKPKLTIPIKSQLWKSDPEFARLCFYGMIEYSVFSAKKHTQYHGYSPEERAEAEQIEKEKLEKLEKILSQEYEVLTDFSKLSYESYSYWYLDSAIQILPTGLDMEFPVQFLIGMYNAQLAGIDESERNYSSNYFDIGLNLKKVIAEYLVYQPIKKSQLLVDVILQSVELPDKPTRYSRDKNEFAREVFKEVIYLVDSSWDDKTIPQVVANFWQLWDYLFKQISDAELWGFSGVFLLKTQWKSSAEHWVPLENGHEFMAKKIQELPEYDVNTLISLIGGIGFKTLAPQGLRWIANKVFDHDGKQKESINFQSAEKLIERSFRNYGKEIKQDRQLLNSYLMLLDALIRLGSSTAYLIRENVLLYKEVNIE